MMKISAVILAGGLNSRFGGIIKAKISIGGRTIISRILDSIEGVFAEKILVTNNPDEFSGFDKLKITHDHFLNIGPLGGIHAAFKASSMDAVFVFAGDMPLLDKQLIISQIDYYSKHSCDILVPRVGQYIEPLHSIYNCSLLGTMENYLSGNHNQAVRAFISRMNTVFFDLEETETTLRALLNVNSPSDIPAVEKILAGTDYRTRKL
jgi:molybdopterin-guanine dinucleotide biosynthesis protein A